MAVAVSCFFMLFVKKGTKTVKWGIFGLLYSGFYLYGLLN